MTCTVFASGLLAAVCLMGAAWCATLRPVMESGTLKCNLRNRDPCANFPDLCSTVGGSCVVKGPCQYECVCPTSGRPGGNCSPKAAAGSAVVADKVTDLRPAETESLLVFSPGLFWDLNHVDSRGELIRSSQQTAPPAKTSTTTTTLKTTTASTTSTTTKPTTTSNAAQPMTTTASSQQVTTAEDGLTTLDTANASADNGSDDQRFTTETSGTDDVSQPQGDTTLSLSSGDVTTSDAVDVDNASSPASSPSSSPLISSLYPAPAAVKSRDNTAAAASGSPASEIHDILEKIKTSFELLTSHILASESSNATAKSHVVSDTSGQPSLQATGVARPADKLSSKTSADQVQRDTTSSPVHSSLHAVTKSTVKV
ncbi:unnamed protein product [Lymnaea stagnalis]|uniref:EGF-like domain-containing protein n=1 Tax=Lymnaea stagnalis TaxID=6523 RepID=A0AAV2H9H9_LYMST